MRIYLFILLAVLLVIPAVGQLEDLLSQYNINISDENINSLIAEYNENISDQLPSALINTFGNERINAEISGETIGVVLEDGKILELQKGPVENPTLEIEVSEEAINSLLSQETPEESFALAQELLKSKEIDYRGVGFFSRIKFAIVKFFQSIAFNLSVWFS